MMNICKLLISRQPDILITFVVTEEWLGFIGSQSKPHNIRFRTLPNTIPSEHRRANDFAGFIEAVFTKMEAPFEELLDHLLLDEDDDKQAAAAVSAIIADTYLPWAVDVGNRRNIPVASLWTMSALVFSVFHHFQLLERNGHFPFDLSGAYSFQQLNYFYSSTSLDLNRPFHFSKLLLFYSSFMVTW